MKVSAARIGGKIFFGKKITRHGHYIHVTNLTQMFLDIENFT